MLIRVCLETNFVVQPAIIRHIDEHIGGFSLLRIMTTVGKGSETVDVAERVSEASDDGDPSLRAA